MSTPKHISDAAKARYAAFEGTIVPPDLGDAEALAAFRRQLDEFGFADTAKIEFEFSHENDSIAGVPVLRIRGSKSPDPERILLHFHGGGFIVGSALGNASLPTQVAEAAGIEVISVDYRLAPEHPFPAALDDALAVYKALLDDYPASKIGVFGESAGGGLTASLALALRDAGDPMPGAIAPVAPFSDMTGSSDSMTSIDGWDPVLDWGSLGPGARAYAGDADPENPLVSASFGDYTGIPPTYIQVGAREVLLGDALRMADACRRAGVDVDLDVWEGMWHCWHFDSTLPESQDANARIAAFFHANL